MEMDKWKNKSFNDMLKDATEGDRAALYMIGMCFLVGHFDLDIDVEKATFWFIRSASLGFGPAIKQIIHTTLENENVHLAMVYINLLASIGHREYVVSYHEHRSKAADRFGIGLVKEIERIASCKHQLIRDNIERFRKSENKKKLFSEMIINEMLINTQDRELNTDYWIRFSKFQLETESEAIRFQKAQQEYYKDFHTLYEKSKRNVADALDRLMANKELGELKTLAIKDAIKAIDCTERYMIVMETFQNTPNANLKNIAHEFFMLCKNAKGALEQHRRFFSSPDDFLAFDENIETLSEYNIRIEMHVENIEKFIEKLNSATK
jgi:TPR repeat protein